LEVPIDDYIYYELCMFVMAIICISQYTFHEFCATMLPRLVLGFTASSSPRRFPSYLVLASSFLPHASPCPWRVSRNTAPRTPRALRWNIVKTFRWWCLGFNWISRKISRKRRISEGENWRRGEISSYPPSTSTHSAVRAVYAVRCFVTSVLEEIRYGTIGEFNVDSKAEYSALSSTRSQKKETKTTPVPL